MNAIKKQALNSPQFDFFPLSAEEEKAKRNAILDFKASKACRILLKIADEAKTKDGLTEDQRQELTSLGFVALQKKLAKVDVKRISYKGVPKDRRGAYRFFYIALAVGMTPIELANLIIKLAHEEFCGVPKGLRAVLKAYKLLDRNTGTIHGDIFKITYHDSFFRTYASEKIEMGARFEVSESRIEIDKMVYQLELPELRSDVSFWSDEEEKARKAYVYGRNNKKRRK